MKRTKSTASRLFNEQAGYTVIEMLMVIAILGLLTGAVTQIIGHAVRTSSHGTDSLTAIKQLENAFHWITIDTQQSRTIETDVGNGFPFMLSWVEWDGTTHAVTYTIEDNEIKRSSSIDGAEPTVLVVARYVDTNISATYCRLSGSGAFDLLDANDAFIITGGQEASSGHITVNNGSVSVTTTGTATYDSGAWATPAEGDTVTITADTDDTRGTWISDNTAAVLVLSEDDDSNANLTGTVLVMTITANGGDGSPYSEIRQGAIFSRS